ncbi:MAG: hypothetical protein ABJA78_08730 [Ferruginibacter sp.]
MEKLQKILFLLIGICFVNISVLAQTGSPKSTLQNPTPKTPQVAIISAPHPVLSASTGQLPKPAGKTTVVSAPAVSVLPAPVKNKATVAIKTGPVQAAISPAAPVHVLPMPVAQPLPAVKAVAPVVKNE